MVLTAPGSLVRLRHVRVARDDQDVEVPPVLTEELSVTLLPFLMMLTPSRPRAFLQHRSSPPRKLGCRNGSPPAVLTGIPEEARAVAGGHLGEDCSAAYVREAVA